MRNLQDLSKDAQQRIRNYVRSLPTISSKELANDLYLRVTTIAAIRANITRKNVKQFNKLLERTK
jgi:ribosome-binding protein aMBF1 (putative translation factor)